MLVVLMRGFDTNLENNAIVHREPMQLFQK